MTPDQVERDRKIAQAMLGNAFDASPVGHWTQALARGVQGGYSGFLEGNAAKAEREGRATGDRAIADALAGRGDIPGMLSNPWSADTGRQLAVKQIGQRMQDASPRAQLDMESRRFDLDQRRQMAPIEMEFKRAQIDKMRRDAASGNNPSSVREWQFFSSLPPEEQNRYLTMKRADQFKDTGTAFVKPDPLNPAGPPVASIPKDVAGAAAQREVGERQGQAAADLPRQEDNAALAIDTINQIRNHPGKRYGTGVAGVLPGIPGTDQRGFVALVDQAKGKTFLEAFNSLKGGGQITEAEGRKATEALARLDRAQTTQDFDKALDDLEVVINMGLQRSRRATGGRSTVGGSAMPTPGTIMDGYRFKGGNPADPNSWERAQ